MTQVQSPLQGQLSVFWNRWKIVYQWVEKSLKDRIGIDTRALAVMRIMIGLLIIVDLIYRSLNLTAFYTDMGVLPRHAVNIRWPESEINLHLLSGEPWFQAMLFAIQGLFALALVFGYKTRIVTIVSFFLLLSLHYRNIFILSAGDTILRLLVFWGIFLPLGERFSIDALKRDHSRNRIADFASTAILIQVVVIYLVNLYQKHDAGVWIQGEALQYIFLSERFMSPMGMFLNHFPLLITTLNFAWLGLLVTSPLLLLATGWPRAILGGAFASAHFGMGFAMELGIFPFVSMVALIPFLPGKFWDLAEERIRMPDILRQALAHVTKPFMGRSPRGEPVLSSADPEKPRWSPTPWINGARSSIAAIFLVWLILISSVTTGVITFPDDVQEKIEERDRSWRMFANPGTRNTWIAVPAGLESGREIDALHRDEGRWDEPRYIKNPYPDHRWRKYLDAIAPEHRDYLRDDFAEYLCQRWNQDNDDKIVGMVIFRVNQDINLDGPDPPPERYKRLYHRCEI